MVPSSSVLICTLLSLCILAQAATLFVAPGGTGSSCDSVASACPTIGAAMTVALAGSEPFEIQVATGSYSSTGNINLDITGAKDISIVGAGQGMTVVDLEGIGRFMRVTGGAKVNVEKMTLKNGFATADAGGTAAGGVFDILSRSSLRADHLDVLNPVVPGAGAYTSTGGAIHATDASLNISNSIFTGARAPVGGTFYFDGVTNGTLSNVTVYQSRCTTQGCFGGALVPEGNSKLLIEDSAFIECEAPQGYGGAIDDGTEANWVAVNTKFIRNVATYGGAVYNYGNTISSFIGCEFIDNIADNNGGAIKPSSKTQVFIDGCLFQGNTGASNGAVGPAADCSESGATYCTVIKNSVFRNNGATSVAGAVAIASSTSLENVVFDSNWSTDQAGALYIYLQLNTYLNNLTFINNTAPNGGAIFIEGQVDVQFLGSTTFRNNTARFLTLRGAPSGIGGAFIQQGQAVVTFEGPTFFYGNTAGSGGGLYAGGQAELVFKAPATFTANSAANGGAIFSAATSIVNISESTFDFNQASSSGGSVYIDSSSTFHGDDLLFVGNTARTGGAVGTGIALAKCPALTNTNFTNNQAIELGGAIYLAVTTLPQCSACSNCIYSGNSAPSGSDVTSAPSTVSSIGDAIPSSVSPSEGFSASFILLDVFGSQVASRDRLMTVSVLSYTLPPSSKRDDNTEVTLRGPSSAYFVANVATFGLLKLSGPPGSTAIIEFAASPSVDQVVTVQMAISPCEDGYEQFESEGTYYCLKANRVSLATRIVITIASGICIIIGFVVLGWLVINRNKAAIRKASVLFCILTTIGAILMFVAAIMWVYVTDATCALRVWLLVLGFVLCYGSIFVKEYRLWLIFDESDIMRTVRVTDGLLLKVVFGGLAVELLICMIWFIVTPFLRRVTIDLSIEEISYRCTSTVTPAFFWILFALNMIILLIGCILAWLARNVPANFNEAKQILFAIYNVTLISVIVVALGSVFRKTSEAISLTVSIGLLFSSLVTLGILFIPKLRHVADKEAVRRAILKDIAGLERDIAWKKRMLQDISSDTMSRSRSAKEETSKSDKPV